MTDPSTLAGELSAAAAECVRYMGKYPDIWRGTRELPAELHTHGLVGNEAGVLTPLGLAVAKHLERSPPQPHSQTSQPDNGRDD